MGLVPNLEFMRITSKTVTQVFLMLELSYIKSGVKLLKISFLGCLTRIGGPR